jgi:hypothetical protein
MAFEGYTSADEVYFGLNPLAFNQVVSNWAVTVPAGEVSIAVEKLGLEGVKRLVEKTPVDLGTARGNWQVSISEAVEGYDESKTDTTGSGVIAEGSMQVIQAVDSNPFLLIWITNNLPYIEALENGHSSQAPTGMLDNTVNELETMFT